MLKAIFDIIKPFIRFKNEKYFHGANNFFNENVSHSLVKGSVLVRYWFGDFSHGSGFGSAEPKNPGSVVH